MAKRGFQGAVMRGLGARDHVATVTSTELIAPKFRRVEFHSTSLFQEVEALPTAWLRFWFPDPDGSEVEYQRAYTIRSADESNGTFSVDFVLHEPAGPASTWAASVVPGATVSLTSLGSSKFELPQDLPARYLLVGDAASIPAISTILETVPAEIPIELYLEVHTEDDRMIPIPEHPRLRTHWVQRHGPESLAAALESRDWSDWTAWMAPESASLKLLRARVHDEFGFPKAEVQQRAYWIHGRAMGKLRSSGAQEPDSTANDSVAATTAETVQAAEAAQVAEAAQAASSAGEEPSADAVAGTTSTRGSWRSQSAGKLFAPVRTSLIIGGVVQALVTLIQLSPFFLLSELCRRILVGAAPDELWAIGIWTVCLMGAGVLLSSLLLFWLHAVDSRFAGGVRQRLLAKLARLPLGWFDVRTSGQVKQLIQDDTLSLHYLVTHAVPDAVAAIVAPVAVLVYLGFVDWRLTLVLFIPIVVYALTMAIMIAQSGTKTSQALRWSERMNSEAGGYLDGQPVVRVFGGAHASTFRARLGEYIAFLEAWQRPFIRQKTLIDLVTRPGTFLILIVVVGALLITTGRMADAALIPFLVLGTTFGARLLGIGYGLTGLRSGTLAARRIQVTLDETELVVRDTDTTEDAAAPGLVEFSNVDFEYRPGVPVITGLSLTLKPYTVTAIVGPSGSGKSTLASLLARFHDVTSGSIRVGGRDIRELQPDDLYARVGFVFQQTQVVHGTVHENIALAVPDASRELVERAARDAQLHERILQLPDGYETVLGQGATLSGGEQQRLTIARALLADTPVLVLDEATAFADPESEYLIQRAMNRLTKDRTVLVIAHRLRTVTDVDQIVVLDHGRIVEHGTHPELLQRNGRYARLWNADSSTQQTATGVTS